MDDFFKFTANLKPASIGLFSEVISLVGAFSMSLIAFILPSAFYLKIFGKKLTVTNRIAGWTLFVFGIFALCSATWQSIDSMVYFFGHANHERMCGSTLTNNYKWKTTGFRNKGDNSESTDNYHGHSQAFIPLTYWSQRSDGISFVTIDLGNPSISSNGHMILASAVVFESDNGVLRNETGGVRDGIATYDGFEIHDSSTTNFTNMDVSVYGIK